MSGLTRFEAHLALGVAAPVNGHRRWPGRSTIYIGRDLVDRAAATDRAEARRRVIEEIDGAERTRRELEQLARSPRCSECDGRIDPHDPTGPEGRANTGLRGRILHRRCYNDLKRQQRTRRAA